MNDLRFQHAWNAYFIAPGGTPVWKDPGQFPPERINRLRQKLRVPLAFLGSSFDEVGPESRTEIRNVFTLAFTDHNVKLGGHVSFNSYAEENTGNILGTWVFGTDQPFDPSNAASLGELRDPVLFSASLPPVRTEKPTRYLAFFAQDDWQIGGSVTLNLGVRWERLFRCCNEELDPSIFPVEIPFIDVSQRGDRNNFAPRMGLTWDVRRDGRTVLRTGYGI